MFLLAWVATIGSKYLSPQLTSSSEKCHSYLFTSVWRLYHLKMFCAVYISQKLSDEYYTKIKSGIPLYPTPPNKTRSNIRQCCQYVSLLECSVLPSLWLRPQVVFTTVCKTLIASTTWFIGLKVIERLQTETVICFSSGSISAPLWCMFWRHSHATWG